MADSNERTCGWSSDFPGFRDAEPRVVCLALKEFIRDAGPQQELAWRESIPLLQTEAGEVLRHERRAGEYTAILEYRLPLESRRPDVIVLLIGPIVVLELKGKEAPSQADLDQVAAYARDLRAYHRECHDRPVHAVVVPTRAAGAPTQRDGVWVASPASLDLLLAHLEHITDRSAPDPRAFLDVEAYRPLPSLVHAARELFARQEVRVIHRARAATEPAVREVRKIVQEAAATRTRRLVLVTGVPGSGKTLVGLSAVHARELDDLAIERRGAKPSAPAVFLSGNGPLVQVLQYAMRRAGGDGKAFVRGVKDYLDTYVPRPQKTPPEHLLVFDEAQRAFSQEAVKAKHKEWPAAAVRSEPEHFVELAERVPEWSVVVGLIGVGQEIHKGEEEGLVQWRQALERCREPGRWTVHAPARLEEVFAGSPVHTAWAPALNLDTTLRFHLMPALDAFVDGLLAGAAPDANRRHAVRLHPVGGEEAQGIRLWATQDLDVAKRYLVDRYREDPNARFGLIASSKDKLLERDFGIPNGFQSTKRVQLGPWYTDGAESEHSCRHLKTVVTEFGAQGLELDMALLAWGADFLREGGAWSIRRAGGYKRDGIAVRSPYQLRVNAYRVLLTRGRDGTVLFVPPVAEFAETWAYVLASGFRPLPA